MIDFTLDETNSVLHVRPKEALRDADFEAISLAVDPFIERTGGLNGLLLEVARFPGWENVAAAIHHFRFVRDHHRKIKKIAIVIDSPLGSVAENLVSHFVAANIKHFYFSKLEEAKIWVAATDRKEIPALPGASIQPYLFFGGRCEEALAFYRTALGAEIVMLMHYKDSPEPPEPGVLQAGFEDKVMHAAFRIGETTLMASDGCQEGQHFSGFSLSIAVPTEAEADRVFAALADGGQVTTPLAKTFWSPRFGMLTDCFGVGWMVSVVA
ncbi:MAG: STAS/SEC14 domain-containing protein [Sulfuriferula sp.]